MTSQVWTPATRDRAIAALQSIPVLTPCSDCEMFLDGWCRQWKQQVPESAQRDGCAEWVESVPF